jgi:hypothetical protein
MASPDARTYDLTGLVDLHIHTSPDVAPRLLDDLQATRHARDAGMRAIVLKSHVTCTADRAAIAESGVPGIRVCGGLALNKPAGGLNPEAVDAALRLGARMIWMPTRDAAHNRQVRGGSGGLQLLTAEDVLLPQIDSILEMIRDYEAVLGTGHVSVVEVTALVRRAREMGLRRIVVTHPESRSSRMPLHVQEALAGKGTYFERCLLPVLNGQSTVAEMVAHIWAVGIVSNVLSTDLGQVCNPAPVEGMCAFLAQLEAGKLNHSEVVQMARENPAYLLGL